MNAPDELKVCGREECDERVPWRPGDTLWSYGHRRYHADECVNAARAEGRRRARKPPKTQVCERDGCDEVYVPTGRAQRYHDHACSVLARGRGPQRETKACECGCGETFERPPGVTRAQWGDRRFLDAEHRKRGGYRGPMANPPAARGLSAPRPVPSPDRTPTAPPVRFGQTPTVKRVEPVERTTRPRPSFGLTRRSA